MDFKLDGARVTVPVPENLTNGEREILRGLAEPGGPLWKIFRSMLDYGEELKEGLVGVDLDDEAERKAMRRVQATIAAIFWVQQTFEQALTPVPEAVKETADV